MGRCQRALCEVLMRDGGAAPLSVAERSHESVCRISSLSRQDVHRTNGRVRLHVYTMTHLAPPGRWAFPGEI